MSQLATLKGISTSSKSITVTGSEAILISGSCLPLIDNIEISGDGGSSWAEIKSIDPSATLSCSSTKSFALSVPQSHSLVSAYSTQSTFQLMTRGTSSFGTTNIQEFQVLRITPTVPTAPTAPTSLSLFFPVSSPGNSAYPIIRVAGVVSGDTVSLYSDSSCSSLLSSQTATGTTTDIALGGAGLAVASTYTFYAKSTNSIGSSPCSASSATYVFDNVQPAVLSVSSALADGTYGSGQLITIDLTFSEPITLGAVNLQLSNGESTSCSTVTSNILSCAYTVGALPSYSIVDLDATALTGTITDAAGNSAILSLPPGSNLAQNKNINIAIVSPASLSGQPSALSNSAALNISVSGSGLTHYQYAIGISSLDCSIAGNYSADVLIASSITDSLTGFADGTLKLCVVGKNSLGQYQPYTQATTITWTKDTTPPILSTLTAAGNFHSAKYYTNTNPSTLTLASADADVSMMYFTPVAGCSSGGAWETYSTTKSYSLTTNASNTIYVSLKDTAGNISTCSTITVVHDDTAPVISSFLDGDKTNSLGSSPLASWTISEANLDRYYISVGTAPGAADVLAWTDIGNGFSSYTVNGLSLDRGSKYYTSIQAVDLASNTLTTHGDGWYMAQRYWLPDSPVTDLAVDNSTNTLYLGGSFSYIGPQTGPHTKLNSIDGQITANNNFMNISHDSQVQNGIVKAIVTNTDGTYYLGGTFTSVGGYSIPYLARFYANGQVDTSFNYGVNLLGLNGMVTCLLIQGSTLYVGGAFTTPRSRLAAVDITTSTVTTWNNAGNINGSINAMAISGSNIYIGGTFTLVSPMTRNYIAALDITTAVPTSWNPNSNAQVSALAINGTSIYAGGTFTTIGGQARNRIAAIDITTASATAWYPASGSPSPVNSLAYAGSTVYVGGNFSTLGGQIRYGFAAVDSTTASVLGANILTVGSVVQAITVSAPSLYIGGKFTLQNGADQQFGLAKFDATSLTLDPTWKGSSRISTAGIPASWIYALAIDPNTGDLLAGGDALSIGGVYRKLAGALNLFSGKVTAWNPSIGNGTALTKLALDSSHNQIFFAGDFTQVASTTRNKLAASSLIDSSLIPGFNPNPDAAVSALMVTNSKLYVGGSFANINGGSQSSIAVFDLPGLTLNVYNPVTVGPVQSFAADSNYIYVGGNFTTYDSVTRNHLARFNTSTFTLDSGFNIAANGAVTELQYDSGSNRLYLGGTSTALGGFSLNNIGAIDLAGGTAVSTFGTTALLNNLVNSIDTVGGLFVGGSFTNINSTTRNYYAQLNSDGSLSSNLALGANGPVNKILSWNGRKVIGGNFISAGGTFSPYLTILDPATESVFTAP